LLAGSAVLATIAMPSGVQAAVQVVGPGASVSACTNFTFSVAITACGGGFSGNLLKGAMSDPDGLATLLALGAPGTGAYLEGKLEGLNGNNGGIINFGTLLTGMTVFGMHAGGAGDGGQGTFFFAFDAGAGVDVITVIDRLNSSSTGLSNAALFRTGGTSAVPEPGTWAMMLLGFGAVGSSLRRRSRQSLLQTV
jgi:hypothetical protein